MLVRRGPGRAVGLNRMKMRMFFLLAALPAVLAASQAVASADRAPLATVEPGQWDLRSRDPANPSLRLCVRDIQDLLQVRHPGQSCRHFVIEDQPTRVSVTYACPRTGHGRTDIRIETPRLVQLSSQGVADGLPFALNLEGRRTGNCPPLASRR